MYHGIGVRCRLVVTWEEVLCNVYRIHTPPFHIILSIPSGVLLITAFHSFPLHGNSTTRPGKRSAFSL